MKKQKMKKQRPLFKLEVGESLTSNKSSFDEEIIDTYVKHGMRRAVRKKRALEGRYY